MRDFSEYDRECAEAELGPVRYWVNQEDYYVLSEAQQFAAAQFASAIDPSAIPEFT